MEKTTDTNNEILMLGTGGVSDAVRLVLPGRELSKEGYKVTIRSMGELRPHEALGFISKLDLDRYSIAVYSRPSSPESVKFLQDHGLYVIVDLDDDFHSIPTHHPGYKWVGRGNPRYLEAVEQCVELADELTVTTVSLRDRWQGEAKQVKVIPNGWSRDNPFWNFRYSRLTVNVGWAGTITHRFDFQLVRDAIKRIARKHKDIVFVIAGDPDIYIQLDKVPEKQKLFLPHVSYEEYPHTLAYFDILLAPLLDDEFNNYKSDIKLVDAGAASIPYIASPLQEYISWRDGGLYALGIDEWEDAILELASSLDKREELGSLGHARCQMREMSNLIWNWKEVLIG